MESNKNDTKELRNWLKDFETKFMVITKWEIGGRNKLGGWDWLYILLYIKQIGNMVREIYTIVCKYPIWEKKNGYIDMYYWFILLYT